MIYLIDLSSAQSLAQVDPARLAASGIRGCYLRVGTGLRARDMNYTAFRAKFQAQAPSIRLGAYHVVQPSQGSPRDQLNNALAWAGEVTGGSDLPFGIDVERSTPLSATDAADWRDFLRVYISGLGLRYTLYMNTSFKGMLEGVGFDTRPRWQAEYHSLVYPTPEANVLAAKAVQESAAAADSLAAGDQEGFRKHLAAKAAAGLSLSRLRLAPLDDGRHPDGAWLHQFGGDANACTVDGVDGFCDKSLFLGSDEEWDTFTLSGRFGLEPARSTGPALAAAFKGTPSDIQTALKALGYYTGAIDGLLGPRSISAIKSFQQRQGLISDGQVGPKTSAAMVSALQRLT